MQEPIFKCAAWIWENPAASADEYADFSDSFVYEAGSVRIRLSCDSGYSLKINGELAGFAQYPDFPFYKVYEEIDLTPYCRPGENTIDIQVWYCGITTASTYYKGNAGLLYEVTCEDKMLACSGAHTRARLSCDFLQHRVKNISPQMGLGFHAILNGVEKEWHPSCLIDNEVQLIPRPIKMLELKSREPMTVLIDEGNYFLIDLGRETVGFLDLDFYSEKEQHITIAYGERLVDGRIDWKQQNGNDFSVELDTRAGNNSYMNVFRRLGCRYLEIFCETPIQPAYIGIRQVNYPLTPLPFDAGTKARQDIYDLCCRTLDLCMHDHYEDCPWREQALYALDSRNQMLCGYYTFKEYQFARASLVLLAKDVREDKLIPICAPASFVLPIASFSLIYPVQVYEYVQHSGDLSILDEVYPAVRGVIDRFISEIRPETGLIPRLPKPVWNFYEWNSISDGTIPVKDGEPEYDLILNCMFLHCLSYFRKLAAFKGEAFDFDEEAMRAAIRNMFYDAETNLFRAASDIDSCTRLGNSLAVLTDVLTGERALDLSEKLKACQGMMDITLSMNTFFYDALLKVGKDNGDAQYQANRQFILDHIEEQYGSMLSQGATSCWEYLDLMPTTSLCHGWSALPAYYYHILLS